MSSVLERWREERGAAWLQRVIAENEANAAARTMFARLADEGERQAALLAGDLGTAPAFAPSWRHRLAAFAVRRMGAKRVRPLLAALKVRGLSIYAAALAGHAMPSATSDFGGEHRAAGGGTLRAGVFGANDGLVSNTCLLLGVAGAAGDSRAVLVSGVAGLLAGAFSMAAGEYISVRSQRELYEHQIAQERAELERYPDEEAEELALIYAARGASLDDARKITRAMMADKEAALKTLAREELGLNPDDLGSPIGAAVSSFIAFSIGAIIPLVPFLFVSGARVMIFSAALAGTALFLIGALLSLFSGRNALFGGARMLGIGAVAGAATYLIGTLLGVGLS